jgi:hypothetical protein
MNPARTRRTVLILAIILGAVFAIVLACAARAGSARRSQLYRPRDFKRGIPRTTSRRCSTWGKDACMLRHGVTGNLDTTSCLPSAYLEYDNLR